MVGCALRDKTLKDRRLVIGEKIPLTRGSNFFEHDKFGHELKDKAEGADIAFEGLCPTLFTSARCLETLRQCSPSRIAIFSESSRVRSVSRLSAPFGRPLGLPDWPGLNFECCGGRLYPTREAPSSAICLLLGRRVPRERHDGHRFGGGAFGVTALQGRLKSLARHGADGVATGLYLPPPDRDLDVSRVEQRYLYAKHDGYSRHSRSVTHVMVPDLCWRSASRGSGARRIGKKKMRNDMEIERVPIAQLKPVVEIAHRTKDDALGGVAVILARNLSSPGMPLPGRAGRNRQFRAGLPRGGRCLPTASPPIRANRFPAPAILIPCSVE